MTYAQVHAVESCCNHRVPAGRRVGPAGPDSRPRGQSAGLRRCGSASATTAPCSAFAPAKSWPSPPISPSPAATSASTGTARSHRPSHPGARPQRPGCHGRAARRGLSFAWPASRSRPKTKRARALATDWTRRPGSTASSTDFSLSPRLMKPLWPEATWPNRPSLSPISCLPVRFGAARPCSAPARGPATCSTSPAALAAPPRAWRMTLPGNAAIQSSREQRSPHASAFRAAAHSRLVLERCTRRAPFPPAPHRAGPLAGAPLAGNRRHRPQRRPVHRSCAPVRRVRRCRRSECRRLAHPPLRNLSAGASWRRRLRAPLHRLAVGPCAAQHCRRSRHLHRPHPAAARAGRPMIALITARGSQPLAPQGWEHFS